ncbi:MAG: glycoside hydrolase family 26 protein [Prevotella sp.]|nr:glycoside hydrolase family 26 protein [Prevotella sp.]
MTKKIILLSALLLVPALVPAKGPLSPKERLVQRLADIRKKGVMYGHQDDPFYGITWMWEEGRSDTKELVGDWPAVMGFDLGGIELGNECNLDSVPFDRIRQEIQNHYRRGGIIAISWHPRNPLLGTTAWIERDTLAYNTAMDALRQLNQCPLAKEVVDPKTTCASVLEGGSQHEKFQQWLCRVTDFLVSLTDDKGNPIPVIFRPWHENNGSWFWWGQDLCSDEEFHALWDMTQDFIRERLPDSIVWSFSPNLQGNWTEESWLVRYPGDDRVDLIGVDAYQWGTEEDFVRQLTADLNIINSIALSRNKLIALTECGHQNSPDPTWWTRVFRPVIEPFPVVYFLPWRNWHKEHFGASKDAPTADDFKSWADEKTMLFLNDIKKIK